MFPRDCIVSGHNGRSLETPVFPLASFTLPFTRSKSLHLSSAQSVHPKPQFNPSHIIAFIWISARSNNRCISSGVKTWRCLCIILTLLTASIGGFNSQVQLSQILFYYPVNFFRSQNTSFGVKKPSDFLGRLFNRSMMCCI